VDKERLAVAPLEDRIVLLSTYIRRRPGYGLLAVNRGLYAEQAQAICESLPGDKALYFIIGLDKALQIFDPRYYADRDGALRNSSLTRV
jgi:hypothetical protein